MKSNFAKRMLMEVFELYPFQEIDSGFIFQVCKIHGLHVVPAFNTHLSQLCKSGRIKKVSRGTYKLTR